MALWWCGGASGPTTCQDNKMSARTSPMLGPLSSFISRFLAVLQIELDCVYAAAGIVLRGVGPSNHLFKKMNESYTAAA